MSRESKSNIKFPVFSKYVFLLKNLEKIFQGIDVLDETKKPEDETYTLVTYLKMEKDALEKFILGERDF